MSSESASLYGTTGALRLDESVVWLQLGGIFTLAAVSHGNAAMDVTIVSREAGRAVGLDGKVEHKPDFACNL